MWKVKLATSLGPSAATAALPGAEKFLFYGRWIALGSSIGKLHSFHYIMIERMFK